MGGTPYVDYSGCYGHRGMCYSNRPMAWGYDAVAGGPIYAAQIEEMRVNIINEVATYNVHAWFEAPIYNPGFVGAGGPVSATTFNYLHYTLNGIYGGSDLAQGTGAIVDDYQWDVLLARYDAVRQNCVCNSNCTCNTICACYGDCGCNYSDERLKENIVFERAENGLNVYSWNYVWDSIKRHTGVIAQELIGTKFADALSMDDHGYYMVNYNKLPITI